MNTNHLIEAIKAGKYDALLCDVYVDESLLEFQKARYIQAIEKFVELYGEKDVEIYSAPGRSEVGGNHTDHQHGEVLAAAINLDVIGVVARKDDSIKVLSDNFDINAVNIHELDIVDSEKGSSEALIRGVVSRFKELGLAVGGFEGYFTSQVLMGSGLSSSAAFEVLIGTILSGLYNDQTVSPVEIAKIGQYAENVYFDKPCGLMDQCASSVGGLIHIDFKDPQVPVVEAVDVDFSKFEHSLCIVDTKGDHADLTPEYAAVPAEMKAVANFFGKSFLREVDEADFIKNIPAIQAKCGDRAVLRAGHLFGENKRVQQQVATLKSGDFEGFKKALVASGNSSYKYLQNVFASSDVQSQGVSLGIMMSEYILQDHGVVRVHGGGFAGTIQAFVQDEFVSTYKNEIEKIFGKDACYVLKVRKYGGKRII